MNHVRVRKGQILYIRSRLEISSDTLSELQPLLLWQTPTCYPNTRVRLIEEILHWLTDHSRQSNILWLYGSRKTGKTTLARTIESKAQELNLLIPTLVYCTSGDCRTIIRSIAVKLACRDAEYRRCLHRQLVDNPTFNTSSDLKTHLVTLFAFLSNKLILPRHLIILDNLDYRHIELTKAIAEVEKELPVLWLILSHEIPAIKSCLFRPGRICLAMEVPSGRGRERETAREVKHFLRENLEQIYFEAKSLEEKFRPMLDGIPPPNEICSAERSQARETLASGDISSVSHQEVWPSPEDFSQILRASSDMFLLANNFIDFLKRNNSRRSIEDLEDQLQVLLRYISGGPNDTSSPGDSPHASIKPIIFPLDDEYSQLLRLSFSTNLTEKHLIFLVIYTSSSLTPTEVSLLLGLSADSVQETLHAMHSVISITIQPGSRNTVSLAHPPLIGFLTDPDRSGELCIIPLIIYPRLAQACITAIQQKRYHTLREAQHSSFLVALHYINIFSVTHVWDLFFKIPDKSLSRRVARELVAVLDVLRLQAGRIPVIPFVRFLIWLKQLELGLVRILADSWRDQELIDACESLTEPLDMDLTIPSSDDFSLGDTPRFVILGSSKNPFLVILTNETVTMYSRKDLM